MFVDVGVDVSEKGGTEGGRKYLTNVTRLQGDIQRSRLAHVARLRADSGRMALFRRTRVDLDARPFGYGRPGVLCGINGRPGKEVEIRI